MDNGVEREREGVSQVRTSTTKKYRQSVVRGHWIVLAKGILIVAIGLGVGLSSEKGFPALPESFGAFWDGQTAAGIWSLIGQLIASLLMFIGAIDIIVECVWLSTSKLTIKRDGIEWRTGFVRQEIEPMNYSRIESVALYRSLLARALNYGTLRIYGVGSGSIRIPSIKNARVLSEFINKQKQVVNRK